MIGPIASFLSARRYRQDSTNTKLRSNPPNESASRATALRFYSPKVRAMVSTNLEYADASFVADATQSRFGGHCRRRDRFKTSDRRAFDFGYAEPCGSCRSGVNDDRGASRRLRLPLHGRPRRLREEPDQPLCHATWRSVFRESRRRRCGSHKDGNQDIGIG